MSLLELVPVPVPVPGVIVIRDYFSLGGCISVKMSSAICSGVVTLLSLELAQWHCWEGLFSMMAFSRAHH